MLKFSGWRRRPAGVFDFNHPSGQENQE